VKLDGEDAKGEEVAVLDIDDCGRGTEEEGVAVVDDDGNDDNGEDVDTDEV
jgi:hypothetical protein